MRAQGCVAHRPFEGPNPAASQRPKRTRLAAPQRPRCHLSLPTKPSHRYPAAMTNAHAPNRKPGNRNARKRRIRFRLFFRHRIPCLERTLSDTDSKTKSIPWRPRGGNRFRRRGGDQRPFWGRRGKARKAMPPHAHRHTLRPPAIVVPAQAGTSTPPASTAASDPTPQAKAALPPGRLVSHTPSTALVSYLGLVPRTPSAAFVSYLRPRTQTRDWQTSAKLGRVSHGHSNETKPSCADSCAVPVP